MANLCKFEKKQYKVSYDNGVTWNTVVPEQNKPGDMIEYDSSDCSTMEGIYRWRVLDGQYLCEDKEKYQKEIQEESYDNGATWYVSYPTVYRKGQYVGRDETYCNDKFEGHYIPDDSYDKCPKYYAWNGYKCVYIDPLKVVKCNDNPTLTNSETRYYTTGYNLISANIGDCVTSIGYEAFSGRTSLTGITIPSSVTSIDDNAFSRCYSLTGIIIPNSVTSIGYEAFASCLSLTGVTCLATTPPSLGSNVFRNTNNCPIYVPCESTISYRSASGWSDYKTRIQGIPPCDEPFKFQVTYNDSRAYSAGCDNNTTLTSGDTQPSGYTASAMTSANIGNCVTSIGDDTFRYCSSLSSVTIPDSVTSIGNEAFAYCSSLTGIIIPNSVTSIGYKGFWGCTALTSITINATTPPSLGGNAFDYANDCPIYVPCESVLTYRTTSGWSGQVNRIQGIPPCDELVKFQATYSGGQTNVVACNSSTELSTGDTKPTGYTASAMTSAEIGSCVTSIGSAAFRYCSSLSSVTIPDSVTSIGDNAFASCTSLSSITIPDSVTSIDEYVFAYCSSLTGVTIGSGVTSIGKAAFDGCRSLTSIDIPDGVTSIGQSVFTYCTSLASIEIPSGVTSIGYGAFYFCTSLASIICLATTPPSLGSNALADTSSNLKIYVPASSVDAYKSARNWSTFASRIQPIP